MYRKAAKSIAAGVKYAAPVLTVFFLFSTWIYSRTKEPLSAMAVGALLTMLIALLVLTGRKKFSSRSLRKREQLSLAQSGKLHLLLQTKPDALGLLLGAMCDDYPVDDIVYAGDYALGNYCGVKTAFGFVGPFDSSSCAAELLELYRFCMTNSVEKCVLFLSGEGAQDIYSLAERLPGPAAVVVPESKLTKYLAAIGRQYAQKAPIRRIFSNILTRKNGERCMVAAAYMVTIHIALGIKWFLFPGLCLAIFAVICRHLDKETAKLF